MSETDKHFELLSQIIDAAFNKAFDDDREPHPTSLYESIEDYIEKTGKRFRMTKNQKSRGLTRDEAFNETFNKNGD